MERCPFHRVCALGALLAPPLLSLASRRFLPPSNEPPLPLPPCSPQLGKAIEAVLESSVKIAEALRSTILGATAAGTTNNSGDEQLGLDILTDEVRQGVKSAHTYWRAHPYSY